MPDHSHALLAAVAGFLLGGLVAQAFVDAAAVIGGGMTLGTFVGGAYALARHEPEEIAHYAGIGAVLGGSFGALALVVDLTLAR